MYRVEGTSALHLDDSAPFTVGDREFRSLQEYYSTRIHEIGKRYEQVHAPSVLFTGMQAKFEGDRRVFAELITKTVGKHIVYEAKGFPANLLGDLWQTIRARAMGPRLVEQSAVSVTAPHVSRGKGPKTISAYAAGSCAVAADEKKPTAPPANAD